MEEEEGATERKDVRGHTFESEDSVREASTQKIF